MSRNAKKIRGKWKQLLLSKVLGLFYLYDSKLCFLTYIHLCLLCSQDQDGGTCATGSHLVSLQVQKRESLDAMLWDACVWS